MSLKISFESDIKGFERVQRALESQQKVLNENAESVERLGKAYSTVSKETNNIRGMESFKAAAGQVKDLTGALDTLIKNQSGLKGFIGLFSEFGREMGKIRMDAGTEVFKSMTTQLDTLRNSMKSTTSELSTLKDKMSIAKKEGRLEDVQSYSQQIAEKTTGQIAEADIFGNLRNKINWHKRHGASGGMENVPGGAGWFQGGLGGGVSGAGLKTGVTGFIASTVALNRLAMGTDHALEIEARGREAQFNRRMTIAQDAAGGNIGRQMMLDMGQGQEAEWMGGELTGRNLVRGIKLGTRQFLSWAGAPFGVKPLGTNELKIEEANRLSELEKSQQFGYNAAGQLKRSIAMDDTSMEAEMMGGMGYTDDYLRSAAAGAGGARGTRIPIKEALSALGIAGQLGIMDTVKGATGRRSLNTSGILPQRDFLEQFSQTRSNNAKIIDQKIKQLDKLIATATSRHQGSSLYRDDTYMYDSKMNRLTPSQAAEKYSNIREGLSQERSSIRIQDTDASKALSNLPISEDYYSDLGNFARDPKHFAVSKNAQAEMFRQFQRRNAQNIGAGMSPEAAERAATKDTFRTDLGVFRNQLGKDIGGDYNTAKQAQDYVTGLQGQFFDPTSATTIAAPAISAINAARQDEQFNQFTPQEKFQMGASAQQNYQSEVARPFGMMEQLTQVAFSKAGLGWGAHRTRLLDLMQKGQVDKVANIIAGYNKERGSGPTEESEVFKLLQEPIDIRNQSAAQMYNTDPNMEKQFNRLGMTDTATSILQGFDTTAVGSRAGGAAWKGIKLGADGKNMSDVADPFSISRQMMATSDETAKEGATLDLIKNIEEVISSKIGIPARNAIFDSISDGFEKIAAEIRGSMSSTTGVDPVTKTEPTPGVTGSQSTE